LRATITRLAAATGGSRRFIASFIVILGFVPVPELRDDFKIEIEAVALAGAP
jgi:hypothetical protein